MNRFLPYAPFRTVYANDVDAFIPEFWAKEGVALLYENMTAANLCYRDFENEIANYGDTVNTRRPARFTAMRITDDDDVTDQNATATNIPVRLNQQMHVTFIIKDGQQSKSLANLVETYLLPAMQAHAQNLDRIVLGQYSQFLSNTAGRLGVTADKTAMIKLDKVFNDNNAYMDGRNLMLNTLAQSDLLSQSIFTEAQMVGNTTALQDAWIGRKFGFNTYMSQNMKVITTGQTTITGAVNNASGYAIGTTTMTIDGFSAALPVNSWFTVAGDDRPQRIISSVGGATPTSVTFWPGLGVAVVDNAVITRYVPGAVNNASGYAAGYAKEITVDGFSVAAQVGQFVSFGVSTSSAQASNPYYTIIAVNGSTGITLDRPLDVAIADDDKVNIGPAGGYNFGFHRNAIALVTRPLASPPEGSGARSAVVNVNGVGVRVTLTYDGKARGTRVTLDLLAGIALLDTNLGGVMLN